MRQLKVIIFFAGLLFSVSGFAINLADAFNSLISTTKPGVYSSQVRGYMIGGGFNVHFPTQSVQLISITPPSYSAGCGGIDLYLGAISFISGQQFVSLLKGIASDAMGYAFNIGLRTLCPTCSTVVSDLQKVAQAANRLSIDQCEFAMGIVNAMTNQQASNKAEKEGALAGMGTSGAFSDFFAGLSAISDDVSKAFDTIQSGINQIQNQAQQNQAAQETQYGSATWKALAGLTYVQKVFIQSVIGTTLRYPSPDHKKIVVAPIAPTITPKQLVSLFMYGAQSKRPDNSQLIFNTCSNTKDTGNIFNASGENMCSSIVKKQLIYTEWYKNLNTTVKGVSMKDYGFFGITYALLFQAINNVKNSEPLGTSVSGIELPSDIYSKSAGGKAVTVTAKFSEAEIEAFVSLAPLPLNRAINIAAEYPSVSESLVGNISQLVASHYAIMYIKDRLLDTATRGNIPSGTIGLSAKTFHEVEQLLTTVHDNLNYQVQMVAGQLAENEAWTNQVNQVQALIYAQTLKNGLIQNFAYNAGLLGGG